MGIGPHQQSIVIQLPANNRRMSGDSGLQTLRLTARSSNAWLWNLPADGFPRWLLSDMPSERVCNVHLPCPDLSSPAVVPVQPKTPELAECIAEDGCSRIVWEFLFCSYLMTRAWYMHAAALVEPCFPMLVHGRCRYCQVLAEHFVQVYIHSPALIVRYCCVPMGAAQNRPACRCTSELHLRISSGW